MCPSQQDRSTSKRSTVCTIRKNKVWCSPVVQWRLYELQVFLISFKMYKFSLNSWVKMQFTSPDIKLKKGSQYSFEILKTHTLLWSWYSKHFNKTILGEMIFFPRGTFICLQDRAQHGTFVIKFLLWISHIRITEGKRLVL